MVAHFEFFPRVIYYIADYFKSPLLLFILFGIIIYGTLFHAIKKYSYSIYESLIIYLVTLYISSLSIMRQSAAGAILFLGFGFIQEKKLIKYIITCIIAFNFHNSAIIGLILYPLYHMRYGFVVIFMILFLFSYKFIFPLILSNFKYLNYFLNPNDFAGGTLTRLFYTGLFLYCMIIALCTNNFRQNRGLFSLVTVGIGLPFLLGGHVGGRLAEYFYIYFILLMPSVNKKLHIHKRASVMIVFYVYFFLILTATVYLSKSSEYVPYRFYFFTDKTLMFKSN
jgi:hypothetical protein